MFNLSTRKRPALRRCLLAVVYSTMAMHAYERAGYNRVKVYDRLGFETYKGIEDFDVDLDYARGYPTDEANYRQLCLLYTSRPVPRFRMPVANASRFCPLL